MCLLNILSVLDFELYWFWTDSGQANSFESVPDLENSMYIHIDGYPCVRLLNLSGEIGCSSWCFYFIIAWICCISKCIISLPLWLPICMSDPGREKVVAPIVRYKSADELLESAAILVSIYEFEILLSRHVKLLLYGHKILVLSLFLDIFLSWWPRNNQSWSKLSTWKWVKRKEVIKWINQRAYPYSDMFNYVQPYPSGDFARN